MLVYNNIIALVLFMFVSFTNFSQISYGIDSIFKKWEKYGAPPEHYKDFKEYHNSKSKLSNIVSSFDKSNKNYKISATNLCYNAGFELSDFTNWGRLKGQTINKGAIIPITYYNLSNANYSGSSNIINNASVFANDFFVINTNLASDSLTGVGYDYYSFNGTTYTLKPISIPNSNYSARIGNANPSFKANKIEYTFKVTANEPLLIYNYSYVFSDGSHLDGEQAAFSIRLTDSIDQTINFSKLPYLVNVNNAINNPEYIKSYYKADTIYDVYFKKWTTDTLNLCNYIGRTFKLVYETMDCTYGAHFCYAYVDAKCTSLDASVQTISCQDSINYGFIAPSGYAAYQWIDPHGNIITPAQSGDQAFLNLSLYSQNCSTNNCTVNTGDVFKLNLTTDLGCVITINCTINSGATKINSFIKNNTCYGGNTGSILINAGGSINQTNYNYNWYTNNCSGTPISNSNSITNLVAGDYCVHITNGNCPPKDSIIHITEMPLIVKNNDVTLPICLDTSYILQTNSGGLNYIWYKNNIIVSGATSSTLSVVPVNLNNIYTVTYSGVNGCKDSIQYRLKTGADTTMLVVSCPNDSIATLISPASYNPEYYQWYINGNALPLINGGGNDTLILSKSLLNNIYVVFGTNNCKQVANKFKETYRDNIFLPTETTNVFTPNNDGVNDFFFPFADNRYTKTAIKSEEGMYELSIYNRWGVLMFKTSDYLTSWDGKTLDSNLASDGTYFWIASYVSNCSNKKEKITKKGFVQLFR